MVRIIIGILLITFFFSTILIISFDPERGGLTGSLVILTSIIFLLPGVTLLFFGSRYLKKRSLVGELAIKMIREKGFIETDLLAKSASVSKMRVRRVLRKLKKKNIITNNINIK
jgi:hypothetical protein